jgi:hypothetical protein
MIKLLLEDGVRLTKDTAKMTDRKMVSMKDLKDIVVSCELKQPHCEHLLKYLNC